MDDWLDSANDGLEDNAGVLGAMGGMAALNNQRASLSKLSEIKDELAKAQASAAKTEKERLAIEKKRLALEQAHLEEQKNTAEAVKELRVLMADADTLLERISQMADAPSSGGGSFWLTRTVALIQVKLELVEKNSAVLSDLADLKEQRRLKAQFEIKLSEFVALKHLPENPLSFVEKEVFDQLQEIWSAFSPVEKFCDEGAIIGKGGLAQVEDPKKGAGQAELLLEGGPKGRFEEEQPNVIEGEDLDVPPYLRKKRRNRTLDSFLSEDELLNLRKRLTKALQKLDQLEIQLGVTSRFTVDHLEELEILWGQYCFLKGKQPNFIFSSAVDYLKRAMEEPEFKSQIEHSGSSVLATIESHLTCARDQGVMLREAIDRIRLGDYEAAHSAQRVPKDERYENPLFFEIQKSLAKRDKYKDCFSSSLNFSSANLEQTSEKIYRAWKVLGVGGWPDDSDLKQRISKNKNTIQAIISKRARKNKMVIMVTSLVLLCLLFGWANIEGEKRKAKILEPTSIRESLSYESLKLKGGGTVVAWGNNTSNQCDVPSGLTDVVRIAAGGTHSLALKNDGTVVAWGNNTSNQCDVPSGLTDVVGIAGGGSHNLVLKNDGTVVAWGNNNSNQCDVPSGLTDVVGIAAAGSHSLALKNDGTVVAWGNNNSNKYDVPSGLTDVVGIAAGGSHNLVLKNDGTVVAWGNNFSNQCDVPSGLTDVVGIAGGGSHNLALKNDGTVVAWGFNFSNQCDVPSGLTDVVGIAGGGSHNLVLKNDGTVVAWGFKNSNKYDVPSGLTDVVGIAAGGSHNLVIKKAKKN